MTLLLLAACASLEIEFSPSPLAFGTVDFGEEMPTVGYAQEEVTITVTKSATLYLPEYDTDRLCIEGYPADLDYPVEMGAIDPDGYFVLPVAICGFGDGELGTDVSIHLDVLADDDPDPSSLPVTFSPVLTGDS